MPDFSYIYKTKFIKMGVWNLLPADSETWHTERTSCYFKKLFGFGKGSFIIQTLDDEMQHPYFPEWYIKQIYAYIKKINDQDYKKLAKIFSQFYDLKRRAVKEIPKISKKNFAKLPNSALISAYKQNRDWANRVACFDQFGWIAEDYWAGVMAEILVKHGLKKDSREFHQALFILTKPEKISTTLEEKRDVLAEVIKLKQHRTVLSAAAKKLTQKFGWLPCFTYGIPWQAEHYLKELKELGKKPLKDLVKEVTDLKHYTQNRNQEFQFIIKKYSLTAKEAQIFADFGLALDTRNEAEYLVSRCGFGLISIYTQAAKRLYISIKQARYLLYEEFIACLQGRADPLALIQAKGQIMGWVFNKTMMRKKVLNGNEAAKFFAYLNKHAKNLQGHNEAKGVCASPGQVTGHAKIVHYISDLPKIKEGDILIANSTTVDFLPGMKKAAAFVTEVGGLTCHAAVVAREFGVPCVVSLKNAVKNFKDNDLIMVNADEGKVTKV